MKKYILLLIASCFSPSLFYGQMVSDDFMDAARNAKKTYTEDEVILQSSLEKYSFEVSSSKNDEPKLIAYKEVEEEYMALKDNVNIGFGDGYDSFSDIQRMKGEVSTGSRYKPVPLQVNDRESGSDDYFDVDYRNKFLIFPMSTLGIKYKGSYLKSYSDARYLTATYFIEKYPIAKKTIEIEIPKNINVDIKEFNFEGYNIKREITENSKSGAKVYSYTIENVPGIPSERLTASASKIYPHIVFLCKNFIDKKDNKVQLFENTTDQYKWYKSLVKSIEDNDKDLKPIVDNLLQGKTNDLDKVKTLYYWVQDNIKYIAFERGIAGFKPDAASMVYKNKYGDCKGMANLLATMLKIAGFDARLTWIGTNDIPYDYSMPSMLVDNHMICTLKLDGKFYYLDGTEKYIAFNDYAERIQGRPVLIEDGDNYLLQNVPKLPAERNKYVETKKLSLDGEVIKSKAEETYQGESQTNFLRTVNDISSNKKEKLLYSVVSGNDKNIEITKISTTTFEDRDKPITLSYEANINNKVTKVGNEAYVSIDYNNDLEGLITDAKRKNPIEIHNNIVKEYSTEFEIPSEYKLKQLPQSLSISKPNYSFDVTYNADGNKVRLTKKLKVNCQIVDMKNMKAWNEDLKKLKEINNEQIIIEKH